MLVLVVYFKYLNYSTWIKFTFQEDTDVHPVALSTQDPWHLELLITEQMEWKEHWPHTDAVWTLTVPVAAVGQQASYLASL